MIQPQAEILNDPQQIQDAIQTEEPMLMEDLSPVQEVVSEVFEHQTTTSQKKKTFFFRWGFSPSQIQVFGCLAFKKED